MWVKATGRQNVSTPGNDRLERWLITTFFTAGFYSRKRREDMAMRCKLNFPGTKAEVRMWVCEKN